MSLRTLVVCCLILRAGAIFGQGHEGHVMHHPMPGDTAKISWRMPPMDPSMPMMPGIEKELPVVAPFLPASSIPRSELPKATERAVVELADGDTLRMEATLVTKTVAGKTLTMYGYNGQIPGPLLRVKQASTIFVRFVNNIELPTTVHWHGLRLDNRFDGVPGVTQAPVETGAAFLYEVTFPDAGLYWYHPHMREDIQQDLGLYGNMVVDALEADYYSPANREEILILDDLLIDAAGPIPYGKEAPTHALMGRFGNVMLVNGDPDHSMEFRKGDVVRFFLTNVANARTFNVTFGDFPVKVVGSDVSRFEREEWVESVPIGPAERYIVEVHFDRPGNAVLTNSIMAINHFLGEFYPHVDTLSEIRVVDTPAEVDYSTSFQTLREYTEVVDDIAQFRRYFDNPVDIDIELGLRVRGLPIPIVMAMEIDTLYVPPMEWNDAMPMMNWLSTGDQVEWILRDTGSGAENMDVNWTFSLGDVVKMRIFNDPHTLHPMNHPIHIHGQRFLVLELDGVHNRNLVWKDTAIVPVGSTMEILVEMSNPGTWMMHCHIAEHLHAGMMLSFTVAGNSTD